MARSSSCSRWIARPAKSCGAARCRAGSKGRLENVNGPASPSPVTDGANVYAFFQDFGLIAFTADGKELWRMPLGPFNMFYGFGASPILVDGTLVLPVDQDTGSYLLGVDAKTGKQRYKVDRPGVISGYSTPTVYQPKGGRQADPDPRVVSAVGLRRRRTADACGGSAGSRAR